MHWAAALLNGLAVLVIVAFLRGGGSYDWKAFLGWRPQLAVGTPRR